MRLYEFLALYLQNLDCQGWRSYSQIKSVHYKEQICKESYATLGRWVDGCHDLDILRRFASGGASSLMCLADSFTFDSLSVWGLDFCFFLTTTPFNDFLTSFLGANAVVLGLSRVSSFGFRGCATGCAAGGLLRSLSLAATALCIFSILAMVE